MNDGPMIHEWPLKMDRTLCGLAKVFNFPASAGRPATCKRCLAALARLEAKAARSNTESSAGRIPRTPGR
jgi:hypothetical protein